MNDIGPYSNYRLTVRLELANKPGMFATVASALAEEGANLGAVDLASATAERMVRDVTFDVRDEAHGERVLARLNDFPMSPSFPRRTASSCCISGARSK